MIIQVSDSVLSFLCEHVFQMLHPIVALFDLIFLIELLSSECIVQLLIQAFKLFFKFKLVCLETFIHLLAFIDSVLFYILDFSAGYAKTY